MQISVFVWFVFVGQTLLSPIIPKNNYIINSYHFLKLYIITNTYYLVLKVCCLRGVVIPGVPALFHAVSKFRRGSVTGIPSHTKNRLRDNVVGIPICLKVLKVTLDFLSKRIHFYSQKCTFCSKDASLNTLATLSPLRIAETHICRIIRRLKLLPSINVY